MELQPLSQIARAADPSTPEQRLEQVDISGQELLIDIPLCLVAEDLTSRYYAKNKNRSPYQYLETTMDMDALECALCFSVYEEPRILECCNNTICSPCLRRVI